VARRQICEAKRKKKLATADKRWRIKRKKGVENCPTIRKKKKKKKVYFRTRTRNAARAGNEPRRISSTELPGNVGDLMILILGAASNQY